MLGPNTALYIFVDSSSEGPSAERWEKEKINLR